MNNTLQNYSKNMQIITNAYTRSLSLQPPELVLPTQALSTNHIADSYVNLIQKAYNPTLELVQRLMINNTQPINATISNFVYEQINYTDFFTQQALFLSEFDPSIHQMVANISNACLNISYDSNEIIELSDDIEIIRNQTIFSDYFGNKQWQKEQFFSAIMQFVYSKILEFLCSLIPFDQLFKLLKDLLEYLLGL